MATYTKIVDANGTVGVTCDYLTLADWVTGESGLYTATDIAKALCRRTGPLKDAGNCDLDSFVAIPHIVVDPNYRHEGKVADVRAADGNYIFTVDIPSNWKHGIHAYHDDAVVDGVAINCNNGYQRPGINTNNNITFVTIKNNLIYNTGYSSSPLSGGINYSSVQDGIIYNNIVIGNGNGHGIILDKWGGGIVANNTVVNCDVNIIKDRSGGRTTQLFNNIATGGVTADFGETSAGSISGNTTGDNNVSSDGTAATIPGTTTSAINQTNTASYFVDSVNGDYHLTAECSSLFGIKGTNLSSSYTTDIDGQYRTNWGVGADEFHPVYTWTVDPNGGADYLSIADWQAGESAKTYEAGAIVVADCKRTGPLKDTTPVIIGNWSSDVSPQIIVNPAHRHEGISADTRASDGNYIYHLTPTSGDAIKFKAYNTIIDGLVITVSGSGARAAWSNSPYGLSGCRIKSCIMDGSGTATSGVHEYSNSTDTSVENCIIYDMLSYGINVSSNPRKITPYIYNNTVYNCTTGIRFISNKAICKNNIVLNCTTCFTGTGNSANDNNVSSDATATGANSAINQTAYSSYFVDVANKDFHLKDTGLNLFGINGADISLTSTPITTDIDGKYRTQWDIGADAYPPVYITTVDPNGGADYLSIADWQAGEYNKFYPFGGIAIADCKRTGALTDTNAVVIDNWPTDVLPKIVVNSAHRHNGISGAGYVLDRSGTTDGTTGSILCSSDVTIDGLEIICGDGSGIGNGFYDSYTFNISSCLIHGATGSDYNSGIYIANNPTVTLNATNNIIYDCAGAGISAESRTNTTGLVANNTIYNCNTSNTAWRAGIRAGSLLLKNNLVLNNGVQDYFYADNAANDYNISSDNTAPGTTVAKSKTNYTGYFVDPANKDFHLKYEGLKSLGITGVDLSSKFATDIDGDERFSWDIGADEFALSSIRLVTNAGTMSTAHASSLETAAVTAAGSDLYSVGLALAGAGSPDDPQSFKWGGSTGDAYTLEYVNRYANYNRLGALTLLAPAAATRTFYGDWATTNDETAIIGAIFSGVDQTNPIRQQGGLNYVSATGSDITPTATAVTQPGDVVIGLAAAGWSGSNLTRTINSNDIEIQQTNSGFEVEAMAMKVATGTSTSMSWTLSEKPTPVFGWGVILIVLRPTLAGAVVVPPASATLSGTVTASVTEADIANGGKTLVITLSGATWAAAGATFDAERQAIIDGIVSNQSEANGWNAIRSSIPVTAVTRTSDTVVTITLPAL